MARMMTLLDKLTAMIEYTNHSPESRHIFFERRGITPEQLEAWRLEANAALPRKGHPHGRKRHK